MDFLEPISSEKLPCGNVAQTANKEAGQDWFWECPKELETEADPDGATMRGKNSKFLILFTLSSATY